MTTTRNIEVKCMNCGRHMYDSDRNETVMCNICRKEEIENTKLAREEEILKKRRQDDSSWYVRREHPDSKM